MAVRPDTKILTSLVEKKHLSLQEAKEAARLPFIGIMSDELYRELDDSIGDAVDFYGTIQNYVMGGVNHLGFDEFLFMSKGGEELMRFHLDKDGRVDKVTVYFHYGWMSVDNIRVDDESFDMKVNAAPNDFLNRLVAQPHQHEEPLFKLFFDGAWAEFIYLTHVIDKLNQRDLYAVTMEPVKKKPLGMGVKNEIHKTSGPSVVWLPSLPKKGGSHSGDGGGEERKPHHRRGHFKTLRAERYKNHPKYGVENAIYVKPAWIGDKEAIVNGTIYRYAEKVLPY